MASLPHLHRRGPLVKLGQKAGFHPLQLLRDPLLILIRERHE
jgi:hypothetical protein